MLTRLMRFLNNTVAVFTFVMTFVVSSGCGNKGSGEATTDTATHQKDTIRHPVITEGGIKDTIPIGVDRSAGKDSARK